MTMFKRSMMALVAIIIVTGAVFAQTEITPEPDPIDCDPAALVQTQAELATQLDAFADDVASDDDDTRLAALESLFTVGEAYQNIAFACGYIPDDIGERTVGTDVERIMTILADMRGDLINGQLLYNNQQVAADGIELGCVGCHNNEVVAPLTEGTWTRWDEIRSLEPQFADYTFEQYIIESIVLPWDYHVPDYPLNTMPNNFGDRMSYQNLADIIAYLESQDQFLDE
jgi:hypothetical protein